MSAGVAIIVANDTVLHSCHCVSVLPYKNHILFRGTKFHSFQEDLQRAEREKDILNRRWCINSLTTVRSSV